MNTLIMIAVPTLFVMACLVQSQDCIEEAAKDSTCASGIDLAVQGSAMLQVGRLSASSVRRKMPDSRLDSGLAMMTGSSCSIERTNGKPLTEDGFAQVSKSCCHEDMKAFMRRVIDDMSLKVCDEGGLSGLAPFYSCPSSPTTLADLSAELKKALPIGGSKCHWLANRVEKCTPPALECGVSVMRPPPAPKPVASGFIALNVTNPAVMIRSSRAIDVVRKDIAQTLGLDTRYVNVVIGSGPLDGEQAATSFFQVPAFHAVYMLGSKIKPCKVFVVYAIQDPKPVDRHLATPAPTLDEANITEGLKRLDMGKLSNSMMKDLDPVEPLVGSIAILEGTVCEKTSRRCTHNVIKKSCLDCP